VTHEFAKEDLINLAGGERALIKEIKSIKQICMYEKAPFGARCTRGGTLNMNTSAVHTYLHTCSSESLRSAALVPSLSFPLRLHRGLSPCSRSVSLDQSASF
jgi:hypothetical protein